MVEWRSSITEAHLIRLLGNHNTPTAGKRNTYISIYRNALAVITIDLLNKRLYYFPFYNEFSIDVELF